MKFFETSTSLKSEDFEEIEQALNIDLPIEFKEHYLNYNGGYPENDIYTWANGGKTTINAFASLKYPSLGISLEDTYRDLVLLEKYLPIGIVPFATDDGGNFFCISVRDKDFGAIYYCNNDHYNIKNKEECLSAIDKSFKHFINNLSK